ncbi:MAG: alpha/beta hydrolase [Anaerolineae bacterium]|nr:alpha/beta hydrolase [Anaerolineae bacterium]
MTQISASVPTTRIEEFADGLRVRISEQGSGRPVLILHGGGGPASVAGFATASAEQAHVITPIHPGFAGEPRPDWFNSIDDLALAYLDLLERYDLRDVMLVGFSMGGWVAAELAVRDRSRLSSLVLVDAVGIQVDDHEIADVFPLTPDELSALSYHNPAAFRVDPTTITPDQMAARAANFKALEIYGRTAGMCDPKLRHRLGRVKIPALVAWGESDGVVDAEYGRAYAQALPNARFSLIPEAGHVPQIEQPSRLLALVQEFADSLTL